MGSTPGQVGRAPVYIAIAILWLVTAALGLAAVYYLHAMSILFYDAFIGREYYVGVLVGQVSAVIGAMIWLGSVIVSGEYHLKHPGQRKSWLIIAWMLGIEILIILAGMLSTGAL